jgi:hypothetical protein
VDVLAVVEKDGDLWEIGGVASAEEKCFFIFWRWREGQGTHYAPVRCTSKLVEMWSRMKALGSRVKGGSRLRERKTRTVTSSAADRETGLVRWSRYRTLTFCDGERSFVYFGRSRSETDVAPAFTRFVAVRTLV